MLNGVETKDPWSFLCPHLGESLSQEISVNNEQRKTFDEKLGRHQGTLLVPLHLYSFVFHISLCYYIEKLRGKQFKEYLSHNS